MLPAGASKDTHRKERNLFKAACGLGAMYGSSEYGLACRLSISVEQARDILHAHKRTYGTFWRWINTVVMQGRLRRFMDSGLWILVLAGGCTWSAR
jgi:DNA polymerase I-like protein with 3'-5' exonuclease and polymerase domains